MVIINLKVETPKTAMKEFAIFFMKWLIVGTLLSLILTWMCSQVIASNVPRADVLETIVKDDVLRINYVSKQYLWLT